MKKSGSTVKSGKGKNSHSTHFTAEELARNIAAAADDKKAYDIVILKITEYSSIADFLVICTGKSTRQVRAIAENIQENLSKSGASTMGSEGVKEGRWALLDYSDVIVHIFYEPLRVFYDLEGLWSEAPRVEYTPENENPH